MTSVLSVPNAAPTAPQAASLRRACRDLEEVFLRYLVRNMKSDLAGMTTGHSAGSFVYDSLAEGAMAGALADEGGIGMADMLYRQLYSTVGVSEKTSPTG